MCGNNNYNNNNNDSTIIVADNSDNDNGNTIIVKCRGSHSTVMACLIWGEQVAGSMLHLGHDLYQNSSH